MKIFVDENIPQITVQELRNIGHKVLDIRGTKYEGCNDGDVWEMAQQEGRLLITTDKGFAQRRQETHYGVLIIRLKQPNRRKIHQRAMQAMSQFTVADWPGLIVMMRDTVQSVWRNRNN